MRAALRRLGARGRAAAPAAAAGLPTRAAYPDGQLCPAIWTLGMAETGEPIGVEGAIIADKDMGLASAAL